MTQLYLIAGEASGDARGAELMEALRTRDSNLTFLGAGGPAMRKIAGTHFLDWSAEAVVGLWDVLKKYGYFRGRFNAMLGEIARTKPAAVILIDYPGFNLRIAAALREREPQQRIFYYISPQVWAWNRGRIPKMARLIDLMLCIFPFEAPLYEQSGLRTIFVGHPMLDSLAARRNSAVVRDPLLIGLFPGSRDKEIARMFPVMLAAAARMQIEMPSLRFQAAAASSELAQAMRALLHRAGRDETFCTITVGASHELMQRAGAGMIASGTATLEAAFFGLPHVILYKVAWLTWVIGRRLVKVPFLGIANIMAGREIAREFLQENARPEAIAAALLDLCRDEARRRQQIDEFRRVIRDLGEQGASGRAADAILAALST